VSRSNLNDIAYQKLIDMLNTGYFKPQTIYSERQISAQIGISRTPFHSALVRLEREGYVDILPSRGFTLHHITQKQMVGIYHMRCALEFHCNLILMRDYHEHLDRATEMVAAMQKSIDGQEKVYRTTGAIPEFNDFDYEFHACPIRYIDQPDFADIFHRYTFWILSLSARSLEVSGRMPVAVKEHQAILDAVKKNDLTSLYTAEFAHYKNAYDINSAFNLQEEII
jgi:DNA-binding GntR family transcriptional regulator